MLVNAAAVTTSSRASLESTETTPAIEVQKKELYSLKKFLDDPRERVK